ncbi:hypothetical protein C8R46DRAFT_1030621 [Mycena filopes]|nr:hypothetical protein C8R46DRAFT_1030621 [Mycena filopes]
MAPQLIEVPPSTSGSRAIMNLWEMNAIPTSDDTRQTRDSSTMQQDEGVDTLSPFQTPSFTTIAAPSPNPSGESSREFTARDSMPSPVLTPSGKYAAPTGQPGRPNSGGYHLEQKLIHEYNWTKERFSAIQKQLEISKSYQYQDTDTMGNLCHKLSGEHDLGGYDDYWPLRAMFKLYLKTSSQAYRRAQRVSSKPGVNHILILLFP